MYTRDMGPHVRPACPITLFSARLLQWTPLNRNNDKEETAQVKHMIH